MTEIEELKARARLTEHMFVHIYANLAMLTAAPKEGVSVLFKGVRNGLITENENGVMTDEALKLLTERAGAMERATLNWTDALIAHEKRDRPV